MDFAVSRPTEDARVWQAAQRQTRTPACPRSSASCVCCSERDVLAVLIPGAAVAFIPWDRGACAWLAARSAATCIKTSTRLTVTHLTRLTSIGHWLTIVATIFKVNLLNKTTV